VDHHACRWSRTIGYGRRLALKVHGLHLFKDDFRLHIILDEG